MAGQNNDATSNNTTPNNGASTPTLIKKGASVPVKPQPKPKEN